MCNTGSHGAKRDKIMTCVGLHRSNPVCLHFNRRIIAKLSSDHIPPNHMVLFVRLLYLVIALSSGLSLVALLWQDQTHVGLRPVSSLCETCLFHDLENVPSPNFVRFIISDMMSKLSTAFENIPMLKSHPIRQKKMRMSWVRNDFFLQTQSSISCPTRPLILFIFLQLNTFSICKDRCLSISCDFCLLKCNGHHAYRSSCLPRLWPVSPASTAVRSLHFYLSQDPETCTKIYSMSRKPKPSSSHQTYI